MLKPIHTAATLGVALAINYLDSWQTGSALWTVFWMACAFATLLYLLATVLASSNLLERPADAAMLGRLHSALRWPSLIGLLVFCAGTLDPHVSALLGRSSAEKHPVERVLCAGSGLRPSVPVQEGFMCFAPLNAGAGLDGRVIMRAKAGLVPPDFSVGDAGTLSVSTVAHGLLTAQRYTKTIDAERADPRSATPG